MMRSSATPLSPLPGTRPRPSSRRCLSSPGCRRVPPLGTSTLQSSCASPLVLELRTSCKVTCRIVHMALGCSWTDILAKARAGSATLSTEHLVGFSTLEILKTTVIGVHYTEENLLDYIDPHNDTLMARLANGRLRAECRIMLGTGKRATITTNWSEFRRRANIRGGDVCAFRFRVTSKRHLVSLCTASRCTIEDTTTPG